MQITTDRKGRTEDLVRLFSSTFSASEGADEGALIGALARALLEDIPEPDLLAVIALEGETPVGCILFTPLRYEDDPRKLALLAPVAVAPDHQRKGVGQALIARGLEELRKDGFAAALTYGDPAYYSKSGFEPITQALAPPPQPLSMPHGWLGQSLTGTPLAPLKGPASCVAPFADPALW